MPRLMIDDQTGKIVVLDKGQIREFTGEEITTVSINKIVNKMGIKVSERLLGKNFANNREDFRNMLKAMGYLVADITGKDKKAVGGFQFAVQKLRWDPTLGGGSGGFADLDLVNGWRVVEPSNNFTGFMRDFISLMADTYSGGSFGVNKFLASQRGQEVVLDIADVISFPVMATLEALALTGGTAAGGPGVGIAAASLTSSTLESLRQFAGMKLGIPQDFDPFLIVAAGVSPGTVPIAGVASTAAVEGVRKGTAALGRGVREIQARIASVKGQRLLSGSEMIALRADTMPDVLDSPFKAAGKIFAILNKIEATGFQEAEFVENFVIKAGRRGERVNLSRAFGELANIEPRKVLSDPVAIRKITQSLNDLQDLLGDSKITAVPARTALQIVQGLGDIAADAKVFSGQRVAKRSFEKNAGEAWKKARESMVNKFGGPKSDFGRAFTTLGEKTSIKNNIRGFMGPQKFKEGKAPRFETVIRTAFQRETVISEFRKLDQMFGFDTESILKRAVVGEQFIKEGAPSIPGTFPRFTAGGAFLGASIVGGSSVIGELTGDDPLLGAFVGGIAAFGFGSPRVNIALTRAARGRGGGFGAPARFARSTGRALSPESLIPAKVRDIDPRLIGGLTAAEGITRSLSQDPTGTAPQQADRIRRLQSLVQEETVRRDTAGTRTGQ